MSNEQIRLYSLMRASKTPKANFQPTQRETNTYSASSQHFHYESGTETSYETARTQITQSRFIRSQSSPSASRRQDTYKEGNLLTQNEKRELNSIHEHGSEQDDVGFPSGVVVDSFSQLDRDSEFTFQDPNKLAITAQKSRFSRINNSYQTSDDGQSAPRDASNLLDETFSYDVSKIGKDHQFQFRQTPKIPKEGKQQLDGKANPKQKTKAVKEVFGSRMTFVKYEQDQIAEEGRRYPYRASRAAPRLKYWEGERTDPINQGYWKRI